MRRLCAALIVLATLPALAAEVYRSIDERGTVVYSDRPRSEGEELISVDTRRGSARRAVEAEPAAASAAAAGTTSETLSVEVRRDPTAQELAADRAKNCAVAQQRADQYRASHRLFRNLPNGEREYLTDAELSEARAKAEADVAAWCD